jgi:hypothetical protein
MRCLANAEVTYQLTVFRIFEVQERKLILDIEHVPERIQRSIVDVALMMVTVDQLVVSVTSLVDLVVAGTLVGVTSESSGKRAKLIEVVLSRRRSFSVEHGSLLMILNHRIGRTLAVSGRDALHPRAIMESRVLSMDPSHTRSLC